jgi:hypothetical protein
LITKHWFPTTSHEYVVGRKAVFPYPSFPFLSPKSAILQPGICHPNLLPASPLSKPGEALWFIILNRPEALSHFLFSLPLPGRFCAFDRALAGLCYRLNIERKDGVAPGLARDIEKGKQ